MNILKKGFKIKQENNVVECIQKLLCKISNTTITRIFIRIRTYVIFIQYIIK